MVKIFIQIQIIKMRKAKYSFLNYEIIYQSGFSIVRLLTSFGFSQFIFNKLCEFPVHSIGKIENIKRLRNIEYKMKWEDFKSNNSPLGLRLGQRKKIIWEVFILQITSIFQIDKKERKFVETGYPMPTSAT